MKRTKFRIRLTAVLIFSLGFTGIGASANAAITPGAKCVTKGLQLVDGRHKYICVEAPKTITNFLSKKLIWKRSSVVTLESLSRPSEILGYLNTMTLGRWKENPLTTNHTGRLFVSDYPCYIYKSSTRTDMINFWNYHVNVMFYVGRWSAIESRGWIMNDVSSSGGCIKYFTNMYGGRIVQQ
jgi:hypothetical protein